MLKVSHFLCLALLGFGVFAASSVAAQACPRWGGVETPSGSGLDQAQIARSLAFAPILAKAIRTSRAEALQQGVVPLPQTAKQALSPYFPKDLLDRVRYRIGSGGITLQTGSLRFGDRVGIVLDDVIVLDRASRLENPYLLAHELAHVMQYQAWGVDRFARYYVADSVMVEDEARAIARDWLLWRRGLPHSGPQIADHTQIDIALAVAEALADCPN